MAEHIGSIQGICRADTCKHWDSCAATSEYLQGDEVVMFPVLDMRNSSKDRDEPEDWKRCKAAKNSYNIYCRRYEKK